MVNLIDILEGTTKQFELLTIHDEVCLHHLSSKSQCSRCVDHCPAGALQIRDGKLEADDCFLCGQCVKQCPVNVFEWQSPTYEQILKRFEETKEKEDQLIVSCSGAPLHLAEAPVLHLPSFGYLLDEIWMAIEEHANFYYYLPEDSCVSCNKNCTLPISMDSKRLKQSDDVKQVMAGKESYDRQRRQSLFSIFRFIRQSGMDSAKIGPKKLSTSEMKRLWKKQVQKEGVTPQVTAEILSSCKDCKACGMLCPERAIRTDTSKATLPQTVIDASKCTGCALCVDICYFNAVELIQKVAD
ncbi:4Fe-4S binding protein [Salisediminibacterium beveridgei]|uniref:Ferredoxin n=1 Tax=Salisediminibacterium beveridgei TaxID=632773 RepID=A0A1D7QX79_9BACI|nr:4Fe-4S binding protein [Salisediminibacterium beveridgei]AOM83613.1 Ferredoxin [Salisediminibacterium beveridgei]